MPSSIAVIAIDAKNPPVLAQFWCQALGLVVREEDDDIVSIGRADGRGPGIDLLKTPDPTTGKNRLHLDLSLDSGTQEEEVERLLSLGASRVEVGQGPHVSWVVLSDPEGNEFCVL